MLFENKSLRKAWMLFAHSELDRQRQSKKKHRVGFFVLTLILFVEIVRRFNEGQEVTTVIQAWGMFSSLMYALAAQRVLSCMYWYVDAGFLLKLPVSGTHLFWMGLFRLASIVFWITIPCLFGLVLITILWDNNNLIQHLGLIGLGMMSTICRASAVAALAGVLVASKTVSIYLRDVLGISSPPYLIWLGMLPAISMASIVLEWMLILDDVVMVWMLSMGGSLGLFFLALHLSSTMMVSSAQHIASMDRQRLAHVELVGPSWIECLWAKISIYDSSERLWFNKDATIMRRRYQGFLWIGSGLLLLVIGSVLFGDTLMVLHERTMILLMIAGGWIVRLITHIHTPPVELSSSFVMIDASSIAYAKRKYIIGKAALLFLLGLVMI